LPEVPADTPETNPLLNVESVPDFDKLTKENCLNAVGKLALELESTVWRIEEKLKGKVLDGYGMIEVVGSKILHCIM
jgi:hypothetical protein